jgi:hypothetical protein
VAENGSKAVLTYRIVITVVVCVGTAFGILSYIKADFREDFYDKQAGIRLEAKQASDKDALEERLKRDREAAEERHARDREDAKEMASQMRQLADSVNACQMTTARLLELYTKALDDKKKE